MKRTVVVLLLGITIGALAVTYAPQLLVQQVVAQNDCQDFPETKQRVCGIFLKYWREHGGLAQQGYPISGVLKEKSSDGKTYDTQYFERAVFEHHLENAGTPHEVLLSLLGKEKWDARNGAGQPSSGTPLQVGQTFTIAGRSERVVHRATITDVQRTPKIGNRNAQGVYIVVLLKVVNQGSEPDDMKYFRLRDQKGRVFEYSFEGIMAGIGTLPGDSLSRSKVES